MNQKLRLVVGISGASGGIYGIKALYMLKQCNVESHLILTRNALITLRYEMNITRQDIQKLADFVYFSQDIGAAISSGSYQTLGMLIAPCSIKTMSEIQSGITSSLISRAADVILKEKRKLVLIVRETPLHLGHLRTMVQLSEIGAIIMPPVPAYYTYPKTIDDIVSYNVKRAINLFGICSKKCKTNNDEWLGIKNNFLSREK
ncbi:3-octaprenyl-4-hydroxybenzoate carboxy-lyase [Candidatus Blochmanniella vafra str. BVAF]|uniref:Flavin prenyltransferase UbiX n=1 Tax=Blochmanniella vafra (strain BVAF) TaxID=859654 RepID=E8Q677_BLOVB|nr:UbiX family flavin prenyltransferase [Candidatus Blochmannia vafer]ADV33771.1 3-octaprenyl-4-hydroxybenzoate carboxy-lyase [Candidatus Blochmannia vafer str. BVAF]